MLVEIVYVEEWFGFLDLFDMFGIFFVKVLDYL